MVYIFGKKYISVKRIIIELVIELMYSIYLILNTNYKLIETDGELIESDLPLFTKSLWYIHVLLIICIILEGIYCIICTYFYDDKKNRQGHVISNKMFQVLAVIIIMMGVFYSFLNSFDHYSCIQTLQCMVPAVSLLLEPLIVVEIKQDETSRIIL